MVSLPRWHPNSSNSNSKLSLLPLPTSRTLRLAALGVFLAANVYLLAHLANVRRAVAVFWSGSAADAVDIARTLRESLYIPIAPDAPPLARARRHRPTDACLEESIARGGACDAAAYGIPEDFKLELVWSWVNSTDPLWRRARALTEARRAGIPDADVDYDTPISRFDNYDELRYSMRAALKNWGGRVSRFHLIAADFPLPAEYPLPKTHPQATNRAAWRIGQVPAWLAHPTPGRRYWIPDAPDDAHWNSSVASSGGGKGGGGKGNGGKDGRTMVEFAVHSHATFFDPFVGTSFSSFGIESQLPNLRGTGDVIVYLNDDMYFLRPMVPADYWSPAYGFTVRAQPWIPVPPTPDPTPKRGEWQPLRQTNALISKRFGVSTRPYLSHQPKAGSLTIWREFATVFAPQFRRTRLRQFREVYHEDAFDAVPAPAIPDPHAPPPPQAGLVAAVEECCAAGGVCCVRGDEECCAVDPDAPFPFGLDPELNTVGRGKGSATKGDVHTVFGFGHFVMERHREALLWSWLVGTVHSGAAGAVWTDSDADRAWAALGGSGSGSGEVLRVASWKGGERVTRDGTRVKDTLAKAGFAAPDSTKYKHSSLDGISYIDWRDGWKAEKANLGKDEQCLMRRSHCFPPAGSVSEAFTRLAFERPECGDCAIQALVRASGHLGLSAFLPAAGARTVRVPAHALARTLPLAEDWRGVDFGVEAVLAGGVPDAMQDEVDVADDTELEVDLRAWVLRVLDRYRYVLGDTPYAFKFMHSSKEAAGIVKSLDASDAATVCLNDDIEDPAKPVPGSGNGWFSGGPVMEGDAVRTVLHAWQTRRWPDKAGWES